LKMFPLTFGCVQHCINNKIFITNKTNYKCSELQVEQITVQS